MIHIKSIFIFLMLMIPTAYASWEGGAQIGILGGMAQDLGTYNSEIIYNGLPVFPYNYFDDEDRDYGYLGGVLAGVQGSCNDWLLGAEVRISWMNMDHHRYFNSPDAAQVLVWQFDQKLKHGTNYGLFTRLGFEIAPYFLPYIHAGAEMSRDKMDVVITGAPAIFPQSITLHDEHWTYRFTGGVGAEFPVPWLSCLSFRVQYMFHLPYTRLQANGVIIDGVVNPSFSTDVKPTTQTLEGAVVWNIL